VVWLLNVWDRLRGAFWLFPGLFTIAAIGLAMGLLALDRRIGSDALAGSRWLYAGGAEGARSLLSAVAGSIITVVGLAFSITIVSLQLAAAQLGPRLLRSFVRDRGNQVVLATFVATFVYCLVVLRTVRGRDGLTEGIFVPHLAVTGALVLALTSVALLIYFIHHASISLQADRVIAAVAEDLDGALDALFPERLGQEEPVADPPPNLPRGDGAPVTATASGYVTGVDGDALLRAAGEADVLIRLVRRPGDFAIAGEPLAWVVPGARLSDDLAGAVAGAILLGPERTLVQDAFFGIEQLVEIAQRSLASDHIDPTTARRCIDRLAGAVARVGDRRLPSAYRRDDVGVVRVVAPAVTFADFVSAAFTPIRLHGDGSRAVTLHLLEAFARLAALRQPRELHLALLGEAMAIHRGLPRAFPDPADRAAVDETFERLLAAVRPDVRRAYEAQAAA
jgi:uncharacterized membrane protein